MLPLVTVVTPCYNRAEFIAETVESVLNQDYPSVEYIVLDDGSTDKSTEILGRYRDRIILRCHPNIGEAMTVNKGWAMASGDYVMTVNSDDPLLPGAISSSVQFMENHDKILVGYPDWLTIDESGSLVSHRQVMEYDYMFMLKNLFCVVGPGAIMRREVFGLTGVRDPEFKYVGDFEYWLRLGLSVPFSRIPHTTATWRLHASCATVSADQTTIANELIRMVHKFFSRADLPVPVKKVKRETMAQAYYIAANNFNVDRSTARKYIISCAFHGHAMLLERVTVKKLMKSVRFFLPKWS